MAQIDTLLRVMLDEKASDLHVSAGSTPYFRIHGDMVKSSGNPLTHEDIKSLIFEFLNEKPKKKGLLKNGNSIVPMRAEEWADSVVNVFMQKNGLSAVFRQIPVQILALEDLKLPTSLYDLAAVERGLILVTGPTGSGKSTTLAALIDYINRTSQKHILTIEDPIEFVHPNKKSLINQRELSVHTKSFANALRAALREDPDIILVGELRDLETTQLAITAAETGHVVFGTLHTNGAAKTLNRIIDIFPSDQQNKIQSMLSESLRGVVSQILMKTANKKRSCRSH